MSSRRAGQVTAAFAVFVLTGLVTATWAARIPAVQQRLHLSLGQLGLAGLCIEAGALAGLPAGGALVSRRGSRWSLRLGFAIYPALLLPLALAPSLAWLALTLTGWAAANSIIDVAMNAAGVEVQARAPRPLLSRLHAGQSAGLLAGGLAATCAAAAQASLPAHFAAVAAVAAAGGLAATTRLPPGATDRTSPALTRPGRRQTLLGTVAFCGFLIDGSASNWAAVDLRTAHHAPAALAAAAYTCFTMAVGAGRAGGDQAVARFGRARVVQGSALAAAGGGVLVIAAPTTITALAGWVTIGAGVAMLAPTVLGAASTSGTTTAGNAIATVTTLGYLGSFTGVPLIGALASLATLPAALSLLPGAATAAALLAPAALRSRHPHPRQEPAPPSHPAPAPHTDHRHGPETTTTADASRICADSDGPAGPANAETQNDPFGTR